MSETTYEQYLFEIVWIFTPLISMTYLYLKHVYPLQLFLIADRHVDFCYDKPQLIFQDQDKILTEDSNECLIKDGTVQSKYSVFLNSVNVRLHIIIDLSHNAD